MKILRYSMCALALVAFAACGGKTTTTTKPTTDTAKKTKPMNPCADNVINPCGPDVKVPKSGNVNPCGGSAVNPCGPASGGVNPTAGDGPSDPTTSESTSKSPQ